MRLHASVVSRHINPCVLDLQHNLLWSGLTLSWAVLTALCSSGVVVPVWDC